jgi:hypothetical protein
VTAVSALPDLGDRAVPWTRRTLAAAAAVLIFAACAAHEGLPAADRATTVADRLFLGREIPGGGIVSDEEWTTFLAEVVTPRFPEGLTIWRADGQWLDAQGLTVKEPVMVIEVLHPRGAVADAAIAEIASEYRRRFRQEAVLRVTVDAEMRLLE